MVLGISVGGDVVVVDQVEESGGSDGKLEVGGDASLLGQHVLMVPSPVGSEIFNINAYVLFKC